MDKQIGQDRKDALRQGRDDLDTTGNSPDHTAEEQTRGERHNPPPAGPERKKPKNG